jgi:acetoacetate decarboxylase
VNDVVSNPFVRSHEETRAFLDDIYQGIMHAAALTVQVETSLEYIRAILPPCFDSTGNNVLSLTIAKYRSLYDGDFDLFALTASSMFKGVEGVYMPLLYVSRDVAVFGGREIWGERKRFGQVELNYHGSEMYGCVEKDGLRLVEVNANLGKNEGPRKSCRRCFWLKAFPSAMGYGFDKPPIVVERTGYSEVCVYKEGTASLTLRGTVLDPLDEIPVVNIIGSIYTEGYAGALEPYKAHIIERPDEIYAIWSGWSFETLSRTC